MKKFNTVFVLYSSLLGFAVGIVSELFLVTVNFLIHTIWYTLPHSLHLPNFYPIIIGLIGGVLVGLSQKYIGPFPKTLHETLAEFKMTQAVTYEHRILRNLISSLIVLGFGASLGPEAALSSILGGLITWLGDRLKLTLAKKELLLNLGIGAMMSTIFHAPFWGITKPVEDELDKGKITVKWKKVLLYTLTTICGIIGFFYTKRFFPQETVFAIRIPHIDWDIRVLLTLIPALIIGIAFGYFFMWSEKLSHKWMSKIKQPMVRSLLAGLCIGLLGMVSYKFLFSGEHELLPLSESYHSLSVIALLVLAFGKTMLTHLCFDCGWRGGKIFPAILASATIGFAFVSIFPYTPGLIVGIIVAASITVILQKPLLTATLLLLLLPLQFFPAVLLTCFVTQWLTKKVNQRMAETA